MIQLKSVKIWVSLQNAPIEGMQSDSAPNSGHNVTLVTILDVPIYAKKRPKAFTRGDDRRAAAHGRPRPSQAPCASPRHPRRRNRCGKAQAPLSRHPVPILPSPPKSTLCDRKLDHVRRTAAMAARSRATSTSAAPGTPVQPYSCPRRVGAVAMTSHLIAITILSLTTIRVQGTLYSTHRDNRRATPYSPRQLSPPVCASSQHRRRPIRCRPAAPQPCSHAAISHRRPPQARVSNRKSTL